MAKQHPRDNKRAVEMAQAIMSNLNSGGSNTADVAWLLAHDHPTLQQGFMRLAMAFIEQKAADHKEGQFDLRSEATCELATEIIEKTDYIKQALPYI